jgi:ATP-dependent Clp protease protease subunit
LLAKRIAVPGTTFYLHSSNRIFNGPQGIAAVEEALSSLRSGNERMATIIAQETSIEKTDMSGIFLHGRTMNADEAKTHGLVHEFRALAMPAGSEVVQVAAAYQRVGAPPIFDRHGALKDLREHCRFCPVNRSNAV